MIASVLSHSCAAMLAAAIAPTYVDRKGRTRPYLVHNQHIHGPRLGPPVSARCMSRDVFHVCVLPYGHSERDGEHACGQCDHQWNGPLGEAPRRSTITNKDLCWYGKGIYDVERT